MILAIDPGPTESAIVKWDGTAVTEPKIIENGPLVDYLSMSLSLSYGDAVACEHLECFGMSVGKTVFETAYWIGRFWETCNRRDLKWLRVYRSEVKMNLCRSRNAKDANIRQALIDRFGVVGTIRNKGPLYGIATHLWSALGVAVTAWDNQATTPKDDL